VFCPSHRQFISRVSNPLLWAGSRASHGKITVSGISNCLNYCVIFIVCTQCTNMAAGRIIQPGGPRVGGEVKFSLERAMKGQRGSRGIALLFL
jgi:hypothetical protein